MAGQPSLRESPAWLAQPKLAKRAKAGGARRDRTADLVIANDALSQLSYGPFRRPLRNEAADSGRHLNPQVRQVKERRVKHSRKSGFLRAIRGSLPLFGRWGTDIYQPDPHAIESP